MKPDKNTLERTALITGGGGGIGEAIAQSLLRDGWYVVLAGRTLAALEKVAHNITPSSGRILCITGDISHPADAAAIVNRAAEWRGGLELLVNNAGTAPMAPLHQTTDAQWNQIIGTNLSGPFYTLRAAWPIFAQQYHDRKAAAPAEAGQICGGIVINISSESSRNPYPGLGAYGAAKAGVNLLTRMAAREGKDMNLRAIAIAPAAVETPMFRSLPVAGDVPTEVILSPKTVAEAVKAAAAGALWCANGETIYIHQTV